MHGREPFFSIIVPTRNRPAQLAACMQAMVKLDYRQELFEVIVVDDGGRTSPETVIARFRDRLRVKLLRQAPGGPASARNTGAAQAVGQFLAFTDDDCRPAPDWLQTLATRFAQAGDRVVGGRTLNGLPDNTYSTASQWLIAYLYAYYNSDPDSAHFLTTNNLAVPTERFRSIGGFDATYTRPAAEDREFCDRWLQRGYRMSYAPEVLVYHAHHLTPRTFWLQHFRYGRGAWRFRRARAARGLGPVRVEPPAFYGNMLRYPFSRTVGWRASWIAALLVVSQVANAAGFLWEAASSAVRAEPAGQR